MKHSGGIFQYLKYFVPTVFTHLLFPVNVQFLRLTDTYIHSKLASKMHVHVTMETECWTQKKRPTVGMTPGFPQLGHGSSARWIIWIVTEQLQRLMTGRNFFADDLVRVKIPYVNEIILNCSRWKKYILLLHDRKS